MEPFEHELLRNALDHSDEDEYSENLRQRLISAPVFEHASALQRVFVNTRLKHEDFISAWNVAHESIEKLDSEAEAQGVLYENVSLKGEGILVPKFEVDFAAGVAMTSLLDKKVQRIASFETYLQPDEYRGKFAGFTLRFATTDEEDVYVPLLAYRVFMNAGHSPHSEVSLFATGDVGTTGLYFDTDEKFEDALIPLDKLFRLCGEMAGSINRINITLASQQKYDAPSMRHVAYHAEKIVKSVDENIRSDVEDALADLIGHYIGRSVSYSLQTKKFLLSPDEKTPKLSYVEIDSGTYPMQNTCLDIIFLNDSIVKDGEATLRDKRSIHLVMQHGDRIAYIPITALEQFEKQ